MIPPPLLSFALTVTLLTGSLIQTNQTRPQQHDLDKALLQAVENGDQKKVLELLRQGASVDAKGINDTALETAILQANVEMVRLLLDQGAKIGEPDLADAARRGRGQKTKAAEIVRLLLERGADLRTSGDKALRAAAQANNPDVVRLLLAKGVPVNGKDEEGDTVLMEALSTDSVESVQALLAAVPVLMLLTPRATRR